jgi:hypothetical protein
VIIPGEPALRELHLAKEIGGVVGKKLDQRGTTNELKREGFSGWCRDSLKSIGNSISN